LILIILFLLSVFNHLIKKRVRQRLDYKSVSEMNEYFQRTYKSQHYNDQLTI